MKILHAVFTKAKEKGGIWFLVKKILSFERWFIMQRDMVKPILELQMHDSFEVRKAKIEDLYLFEDMSKKVYIDMESFEKRLRSDQTCYMALDQGKIIYFVWVSSSDVPKTVTSHVVKLKPQEVCMYHAFCLPEYRRKRIHSSIMSIRLKELQEKSFDNAKVDCRINNLPQIKTLLRHGFVPHRMVWVMTIAGMRFHYSFKQSNIYPIKWTQG